VRKIILAALAACAVPAGAHAQQQVVLTANNVVGASSVYDQGAGAQGASFVRNGARVVGQYGAGNIFNEQGAGPAVETFGSGQYFLTGDGRSFEPTVANPYITIDLGGTYTLSSFSLFNTSNGSIGDRGTADFSIRGANALADDGANGATLGGVTTLLVDGTLARHTPNTAPVAQTFASLSGAGFRYLQFAPTSAAAGTFNAQSLGLNELRVFGTATVQAGVPEPATWAMMIGGFGLVGAAGRRRRTAVCLA